jgi:hypothetical protein
VPRQLRAGRVVEIDTGGAEVLGEMSARAGSRYEQDVRCEIEQPGEGDLGRRRAQPCRQRGEHGTPEHLVPHLTGPSQRAERNEGDVPFRAFHEDVQGSLICQVEEILHADDLRLGDGSQAMIIP